MKKYITEVVAVVVCEFIGITGSYFTVNAIPTWYAYLKKPDLSPPNWVFGPVWTILYFLMGLAVARIWRLGWQKNKLAMTAFGVQLALNFLWSFFFFGMRAPTAGLVDIGVMWLAIGATIFFFGKLDKKAALMLLPYWLWVSFASWLNWQIVQLN